MSIVFTYETKLTKIEAGALALAILVLSLELVIIAFDQDLPQNRLFMILIPQAYVAISYYLQHRKEVDSILPRVPNKTKSCENLMKFGSIKKDRAINYWLAVAMPPKSP